WTEWLAVPKKVRSARSSLSGSSSLPLESIIATAELTRRPSRPPNYEAENRVLVELVQEMGSATGRAGADGVLQKLVEGALKLCAAHSAGVSILEKESGRDVLRWRAVAGIWEKFLGVSIAREASPCGAVIDRNVAMLMSHPERHYRYKCEAPPVAE